MEPLRPQDPRQAGAYRLTGRLGEGGQGVVFLGEAEDGRQVAVKFLKAENVHDRRFRQRFAREVATAQLVSGPYTAPVMAADPDGDPPWLATAYIPGSSLADTVARDGPLDEDSVRTLGAGLAEGLASIHVCGLVHRDLKPANVILSDDGPRIIDFGASRTMTATTLTSAGMVIGTVGFMSPEQVGGTRVDTRSDVFSLGAILAFAATGQGPFAAPSMAATAARIVGGPPGLEGVGDPLRAIIEACLVKDPAARPGLDTVGAALRSGQPLTGTDYAQRIVATDPFPAFPLAPETAAGLLPLLRKAGPRGIAAALVVAAGAGAAIVFLPGGGPAPKPPAARPASATPSAPFADSTAKAATTPSAARSASAATARPAAASSPARRPVIVPAPARTRAAAPAPPAPAGPPPQAQRHREARGNPNPGSHGGRGGHGGHGGPGGHGR